MEGCCKGDLDEGSVERVLEGIRSLFLAGVSGQRDGVGGL